jgi:hypothetical protein
MLEIAQNFEQMAAEFSTIVLIASGLACLIGGLFIWLGGLGFRKLLVALVGGLAGGICAFFLAGQNVIPALVSAALAACLAVVFERLFITIVTAALAAVFAFAVLAEVYNADFSNGFKHACLQMPLHSWAIIAALIVIFILAELHLWRLTSALCCATLGTMLVFAGMILLLLYKSAAPVSYISARGLFFAAVFVVMIAFGTIEQLLFCPLAKGQPIIKKQVSKSSEETPDEESSSWRNR